MGYHRDNVKMMKQPKQLQSIPPHMSYTWPLFCCWTDLHMPPQLLTIIIIIKLVNIVPNPTMFQSICNLIFKFHFGWVVSKWELMKVWPSTPKRPILVPHPK